MLDELCKENVICCDDNCKRCANLIYQDYRKLQKELAVLRNFIYDEGLEERLDSYIKLLSDMEDSNENS